MVPRGRGKIKNSSLLATWPLWFVPLLFLTLSCSAELVGSKISSTDDGMFESFARNDTIEQGFCFPGSPSEPVSVSVTDRPPNSFFEGYHGPALALSFRWRKPSPSNRVPYRLFPFFHLPTVWPSAWPSVFSSGPDGNMTSFRAPGTTWTAQPIRRSGRWMESSSLQCPVPKTRAHFQVGVIRTAHQCSLDSAPCPKAPVKPNPTPTRALKVRLNFLNFFDAPPRVGGCASKRLRKKQKKEKKENARIKRQQEAEALIPMRLKMSRWLYRGFSNLGAFVLPFVPYFPRTFFSCCLFSHQALRKCQGKEATGSLMRIVLAECMVLCFVDDMLLAGLLRFGVILSVTTIPSVYDRVFTTASSVHETENSRYESPLEILLIRIALTECFVRCFVGDMVLTDVLRFGGILLMTAEQVVFFMMSFCVFTTHY